MPRLTNIDAIRRILETDRIWSAFSLADLTPGYKEHAEWYVPSGEADALALVYRAFDPPLFVPTGPADRLREVIEELAEERRFYISVRRPGDELFARAGYRLERSRTMYRMALEGERFAPLRGGETRGLEPRHIDAVRDLYKEGEPGGEDPEFFLPEMLETGVFEGCWEGDCLVAAGGTQVYAPSERVAAVGNIYVRSDRRGQGYGMAITSAVIHRIRSAGVSTIVLNVVAANTAAIRMYKRLGFRVYCDFIEAVAFRSGGSWPLSAD